MSSNPKNILFRADSSSTIGIGHIMRDLVLAKQYPDVQIIFASQNLKGNINHKIVADGYSVEILGSNDISELVDIIQKLQIDMVVIDHYEIDYEFEKKIKELHPNLQLFVLDDTYERHHCDILLNHNISADSKRYKDLVPRHCELRCGAKYTLLRDEFVKAKRIMNKVRDIKNRVNFRIFIAIGGTDPQGYNFIILNFLLDISNITIAVVTTDTNKRVDELKALTDARENVKLYINSQSLVELMNDADIAIITPSVIANEIIYMQIPFIAIKIINNQDDMYQFLKEKGFFVMDSSEIKELPNYIKNLIKSNIYNFHLRLLDTVLNERD